MSKTKILLPLILKFDTENDESEKFLEKLSYMKS
jgi:hypothetical protein